jgi:hypothetical protein
VPLTGPLREEHGFGPGLFLTRGSEDFEERFDLGAAIGWLRGGRRRGAGNDVEVFERPWLYSGVVECRQLATTHRAFMLHVDDLLDTFQSENVFTNRDTRVMKRFQTDAAFLMCLTRYLKQILQSADVFAKFFTLCKNSSIVATC